jgi:hypothetical protein
MTTTNVMVAVVGICKHMKVKVEICKHKLKVVNVIEVVKTCHRKMGVICSNSEEDNNMMMKAMVGMNTCKTCLYQQLH